MGLLNWPKCPRCGERAVEMGKGKKGWKYTKKGPARLSPTWMVGGNMSYRCICGNEWEVDKEGNIIE